jgi:hypothetical protein
MDQPLSDPRWERYLAPRALFAGIAVAFLACILAGHVVGRHNYLKHFERFHSRLTAETLYYPTARQVRSFGRECLDPDKIVVVVGGSSILHGTGQRVEHVWTRKLQELLGEEYQVVNFALRCGLTAEFGEICAEIFQRDHQRILFVSDMRPGTLHPDPEGCQYRHFFWDAYYKNLTLADPLRDARLAEEPTELEALEKTFGKKAIKTSQRMPADEQREQRTEMALDRALYFEDLWNTIALTCFHTMWTMPTREDFTLARRSFADDERGALPLADRYQRDNEGFKNLILAGLQGCVRDGSGRWTEDDASPLWLELERRATYSFPAAIRPRTLVLVMWPSPHYIRQFTPDQKVLHAAVARLTVEHMQKAGVQSLEIGQDHTPEDYADWVHLTEEGGAKTAEAVAPAVRAMARILGYTRTGGDQ